LKTPVVAAPLGDTDAKELSKILLRAAAEDPSSISDLYDRTARRVFSVAWNVLRNRADAEEVTCDVYVYVWRNARRYDPNRGPVIAWLRIICRSRAIDRLRKVAAALFCAQRSSATGLTLFERMMDGAVDENPELALDDEKRAKAIHSALKRLSPLLRRLLELAYFEDFSHAEISTRVGIPLGTVKSHIRRTLSRLNTDLRASQGSHRGRRIALQT
jgi:RNA polymerase sigma-70 factor, ECF subfamily